ILGKSWQCVMVLPGMFVCEHCEFTSCITQSNDSPSALDGLDQVLSIHVPWPFWGCLVLSLEILNWMSGVRLHPAFVVLSPR
ncbi:hypothetical protein ACSYAD_36425, partial [Acaryochloris marina NIES-2412]|uniref:hypothetical protein n=1 Tax=Acaryochloris marina TaxID=155978 RepID=UPI004058901A